MPKIVDGTPPNKIAVECPLISFGLQVATKCAVVDQKMVERIAPYIDSEVKEGDQCPFFNGLLDQGDEVANHMRQQMAAQGLSEEYHNQAMISMPFHERYRIRCGCPHNRRLIPIAGMGGE